MEFNILKNKTNIIYISILFFIIFLWLASSILLPFIMGILLAYVLNPLVNKLKNLGLGHQFAVLIALIVSLCFFFGGFIFLIPLLLDQISNIIIKFPLIYEKILFYIEDSFSNFINYDNYLASISNILANKSGEILSFIINILSGAFLKGKAFVSIIGLTIITPIVTCYILYDWDKIKSYLTDLIPRNQKKSIGVKIIRIDSVLSSFFRGKFIISLFLIIYYSTLLSLINLEGAFSIGSIIGVLSFIPYLGTILGLILALSFGILQMGSFIIIAYILIIFILGQIIESYILEPKFISKNVGLHPLVGMFMIIAGGAAFGIIGVLLAIPVAAVLAVILFEKE